MKKKYLAVIGVANPSWDLLSVVQNANLMPSESQHVRLVLSENDVDYLLSRHHSNRWVLAPQPPSSGRVFELTTSDLHDRIESGSLDWCHPEKAVFTGMTRVSGGDGSDEGELEDHFDSSDSDPEDDEGDVSDDGSLEEIEAPSRNSGTRSIYSLSKFTPIADFMKSPNRQVRLTGLCQYWQQRLQLGTFVLAPIIRKQRESCGALASN
jgi:hypothetical protein